MEKDLNDSVAHNSSCLKESETEKSFVGKVKSIITNTPLSKWFWKQNEESRSTVRRRDEVFEDDEMCEMQPPLKKTKLPAGSEGSGYNHVAFNDTPNISVTNHSVTKAKFNSFDEPVAGPSGIKSRKLFSSGTTITATSARNTTSSNELLNGLKDSDSEESTSGYSSFPRIDSKEQVCGSQESSKQTSPLQSSPTTSRSLFNTSSNTSSHRTLFADRRPSPHKNTSMSSRRPSFNASTFGSPDFVDKTIATKKIIESPFYNGRTIYGGASAYGRNLGRTSKDLKTSLKNSVQIKPVNKSDSNNLVLGKTARKILETLEQYNSPINDAKKIPVVSRKQRQEGLLVNYIGANPYIVKSSKVPSNKELVVPTVPELLKMKQRMRLQDSTEMVKQIACSSKPAVSPNTEYYKIYTNESEREKHTGKLKTKVTAPLRQKQMVHEPAIVNLKPVPLPITTLPKFDLNIPPPTPPKKSLEIPTQPTKQAEISSALSFTPLPPKPPQAQPFQATVETEKRVQTEKRTTTSTIVEYKFSDPVVIAENIKSLAPVNNFKFSDPICKKPKADPPNNATLNFRMPENRYPNLTLAPSTKSASPPEKKTTMLKTGSIMDVLGKKDDKSLMDKFKPAQGTWECSACMIRNQPEKTKCVACETPRAPPKQTVKKDDFGSQFKMTADKWECGVCMVRNASSDAKCVACETPKAGATSVAKGTPASNGPSSGFGDKFKPSGETWECPICMIRNKNELAKCAACETANPKASNTIPPANVIKFQPPANSWECDTCLVRNKADAAKCVACEAPKVGSKPADAGFGGTFKIKDDEWECGVCMVRNKTSSTKCQCCDTAKPGSASAAASVAKSDKKPISTFNFGIDKASATSFSFGIPGAAAAAAPPAGATNASSVFGENRKTEAATPVTFSFGVPATAQKTPAPAEPVKPVAAETVKPALQASNPLLKPDEKLPEKVETAGSGFKFQVPTSNQNKPIADKPNTATPASSAAVGNNLFNFKPAAANGDIKKTPMFGLKTDSTSNATFSAPAVANANIFSFGAKEPAPSAPATSVTSTQSSQPAAAKPVFKFGSGSHATPEMPSTTVGAVSSTATSNGFVTTNTPSFPTTSASGFGAPSSEIKPFSFNVPASSTGEPASKAPAFSFGQSSTDASAKAPGFNFGAASAPTFNFATGKTETPSFSAPSNNIFGAAAAAPAGKNGTFNFGSMTSANTNQKAGFSFGAAVNSNAAAPSAQAGFNFGAAAPAPSSGGFNFTGALPTFNAGAKPSFNFTDGSMATFAAQPSADSGLPAPRKIKRAVRRTQR